MIKWNLLLGVASTALALTLTACSDTEEDGTATENHENMQMENSSEEDNHGDMHMDMDHSGSGEIPDGLQEAENPTYEVGSQVTVEADHMAGMQGVQATIAGAFDTTVYSISYTPTDGSQPVEEHKWVVHEELENPSEEPLQPGTEVTVNADHMAGMDGATAVIDSAEQTTVYMIDYTTSTGEKMTNHMWVTEAEISAD